MVHGRSDSPGSHGEDRYIVVSVDSHVGPSVNDQLREYCPAQHLSDFDRFVGEMESHGLLSWRSSEAAKQVWERSEPLRQGARDVGEGVVRAWSEIRASLGKAAGRLNEQSTVDGPATTQNDDRRETN